MACGSGAGARSCPSTPATCATSRSGPRGSTTADLMPHAPDAADAAVSTSRLTAPGVDATSCPSRRIACSRTASTCRARSPGGSGLVWAAVRDGDTLPRTRRFAADDEGSRTRASLVQVTNLGHHASRTARRTRWSSSPALIPASRCAGAARLDRPHRQHAFWRGTTGADGVAIAPDTPLRDPDDWYSSPSSSPPRRTATSPTSAATGTRASRRGSSAPASTCTKRPAAAWHGLHRSRRLPAWRGGALQGDPAPEHAPNGIRLFPEGTPVPVSVRDGQNRQSTRGRSGSRRGAAPSGP